MPRCKNVPDDEKPIYYKGNELSPKGRGYVARFDQEGKERIGLDRQKYIVKNGRWVLKTSKRKSSPRGSGPQLDQDTSRIIELCNQKGIRYSQATINILKHMSPAGKQEIYNYIERKQPPFGTLYPYILTVNNQQ